MSDTAAKGGAVVLAVNTVRPWANTLYANERGYPATHAFDGKDILCGRDIWFQIGAEGVEHVNCKQCLRALAKRAAAQQEQQP